jgi:hypothetical protein
MSPLPRSDPQVLCVDPARIEDIWPHVRDFIAAAFDNDRGDDCADDVHGDLLAKRALLWVAWDGGAITAAATTKLLRTARGLVCIITSCGGREMRRERWRAAIEPLETYARAEGCRVVRFEGRRGWKTVFPDYREAWVSLEKRLIS